MKTYEQINKKKYKLVKNKFKKKKKYIIQNKNKNNYK
jgi:hypothetical protein